MSNYRLFQTERLCRRQFKIGRKWQKVIQTGRKHCGKRRNCSSRAIYPFPTVFSKGLFPRGVKSVIMWEWVKPFIRKFQSILILNQTKPVFTTIGINAFDCLIPSSTRLSYIVANSAPINASRSSFYQ